VLFRSGGPSLSSLERELVAYACHDLDGSFPIARLYARFRGSISHRQLVKLARRWEANGWLSAPASPIQARQVTEQLRGLAQPAEVTPRPASERGSSWPAASA
jgi:hypothetical protein